MHSPKTFHAVRQGGIEITPFELADKAIDAATDGNTELAHKLLDEAIRAFEPVRKGMEELERERRKDGK